jgi:acetylornithine deacetylase
MSESQLDLVALLADLVRVPSVNPRGRPEPAETALAEFVLAWCDRAGITAYLDEVVDGRCNVVAEVPGDGEDWILLETHLDTVETDGMTTPPFDPVVRGGRLFGRGACDAKASLAVFLAVLANAVRDRPRIGVRVAGVIDEEHRYRGVTHLIGRGAGVIGAVVGEPTELGLVVAHKGCVRGRIVTAGNGGHSSAPEGKVNAIAMAADVVAHLRDHVGPELDRHRDALVGPPTLAVTTISGGTGPNTLPERCEIGVDRRIVPGEDPVLVWAALRDDLERRWPGLVTVSEPDVVDPALPPSSGDPFVARLRRCLADAGLPATELGVGYGTDASKLARAGVPTVVFGPGSIMDAHSANESVDLAQLPAAVDVLTALVRSAVPCG